MSHHEEKIKYGILCPSTNIFYEITDELTYRALLEQL